MTYQEYWFLLEEEFLNKLEGNQMTNLEKIKRLNELQRKIEKIQEEMYYVKHAKKLRFIHYVSSGRCGVEDHEKSKMIDPSSTLLSNVKEITLKILNEEIAEMEKEIESIFNNTIIEEEFLTMEGK